jgi:hypothetical protein
MLPLRATSLPFDRIAEYWSKQLGQIRSAREIHQELLAAFWHGVLPAHLEGRPRDRRRYLKAVRKCGSHPDFELVESADAIPPGEQELPDGGAVVDLTCYVVLPSDEASWSEAIVEAACEQLAEIPPEGFNELILPGILALHATKENIGRFCDEHGYARPTFWFGQETQSDRPRSFVGRPSVMRQIQDELRRRATAQALAPRLRDEAKLLRTWAETHIPSGQQLPGWQAIENAIRAEYKRLRGGADSGP